MASTDAVREEFVDINIDMEEASIHKEPDELGYVRVTNETPLMIGTSGDLDGIPTWILAYELLNATVKHVTEEAHTRLARDLSEMVLIEIEFKIYGSTDVGSIEIRTEIGNDNVTVSKPRVPYRWPCESREDGLDVDFGSGKEIGEESIRGDHVCCNRNAGVFIEPSAIVKDKGLILVNILKEM